MNTSRTTNYELQGTGRATRAPVAQTLQSVRQTCPRTTATCPYPFARFPSCGNCTPTRTSPVKQQLEPPSDGAGETSRTTNYELQGKGGATRAPVAQTLQSVRQTCSCTTATCSYTFARFPSCGIFIPTRTSPVKQQVGNNRVTVTGETSGTTNYELHGTGWATHAPVAQTL